MAVSKGPEFKFQNPGRDTPVIPALGKPSQADLRDSLDSHPSLPGKFQVG